MTTRFDIKTPRPRKDGKTFWLKVGTLFANNDGSMSIVLDALPLPNEKGQVVLKAWPPKDGDRDAHKPAQDDFDDGVPF